MNEKDPIEQIVQQLAELLNFVEKHKLDPKEKMPEGIEEALQDLEQQVAMFKEVTEETMKEMGIDQAEVKRRLLITQTGKENRSLKQLTHLRNEVKELRYAIAYLTGKGATEGGKKDKASKREARRRSKKRYKRIDDKWKPV